MRLEKIKIKKETEGRGNVRVVNSKGRERSGMKRAILVIYRNPWEDTGTRRITVVQFQDARVAPVISERGREGAEQRARLSLARVRGLVKRVLIPNMKLFRRYQQEILQWLRPRMW